MGGDLASAWLADPRVTGLGRLLHPDSCQIVRRLRPMGLGGGGSENAEAPTHGVHLDPRAALRLTVEKLRGGGSCQRLLGTLSVERNPKVLPPAVLLHPALVPDTRLHHGHRSPPVSG